VVRKTQGDMLSPSGVDVNKNLKENRKISEELLALKGELSILPQPRLTNKGTMTKKLKKTKGLPS
jgi:hypothetical protein